MNQPPTREQVEQERARHALLVAACRFVHGRRATSIARATEVALIASLDDAVYRYEAT